MLGLLAERPMHGYELITALEERSGGRWRPSPGSIYPALRRLEHRGFVTATDDGGKRRFELTEAGRERVAEHQRSGAEAPWDDHGLGRHGELRRAVAELTGPARQIGRFGSSDQIAAAVAAITDTTTTLYRILADGRAVTGTDDDTDEKTTADDATKSDIANATTESQPERSEGDDA